MASSTCCFQRRLTTSHSSRAIEKQHGANACHILARFPFFSELVCSTKACCCTVSKFGFKTGTFYLSFFCALKTWDLPFFLALRRWPLLSLFFSTDPTQIPWTGFFLRLRLERQTSRSKWKCWMQLCWVMKSFLLSTSTPWRLKDTLTVIPDSRQRLQKCHGSIAVISSFWMWLEYWDIWAFHQKKHSVGAVSNTLQLPFESFSVQTLTNRIRQGANEDNEKRYLWEGLKTVKVLCFYMFPCVSGFSLDMPSSCGTFWRIHRSIGARAGWSHVISTFWSFWHSHAASLLDRIRNGPQMYDDPCCHHSNNMTHSYIEWFCPQCVHTMGFLRHCRGVKGWVDPGLAPACPSNFVTLDLPFWRKSRWKHTQ